MVHLGRKWTPFALSLRLRRLAVALIVGLGLLTLTSSPAFAYAKWGNGSVQCSFSAKVSFSPPLTASGGGTNRSRVRATMAGCRTTAADNLDSEITGGAFQGSFAHSPLDCATLSTTDAPVTGIARWTGLYYYNHRGWHKGSFHPSYVVDDAVTSTSSSFLGEASVFLNVPSTLASGCATRGGVKVATLSGTITVGPSCGPATGPFTLFQLDRGSFCGDPGQIGAQSIAFGPDGALWFVGGGTQYAEGAQIFGAGPVIGRMTTSGVVTNIYSGPGIDLGARTIIAGPDGALWFTTPPTLGTNTSVTGATIGRMTTSGVVTTYPLTNGDPSDITVGSDGALWFTADEPDASPLHSFIGRISTSGVITTYTDSSVYDPTGIAAGPDGALWFTSFGRWVGDVLTSGSIGRITTSGVLTSFTGPNLHPDGPITAGPDGALWFTNGSSSGNFSIARITTSGSVSYYTSPNIDGPEDLTAGPDGALWFTNANNDRLGSSFGSIGRITTSGTVTDYTSPGVDNPHSITAGPDRALWFTNANNTIGRITTP
jgi:streptogramin lyase